MNELQETFYSLSYTSKRELLNHGIALLGMVIEKKKITELIEKYEQNEKDDYSYDTLFHHLMDELEALAKGDD